MIRYTNVYNYTSKIVNIQATLLNNPILQKEKATHAANLANV